MARFGAGSCRLASQIRSIRRHVRDRGICLTNVAGSGVIDAHADQAKLSDARRSIRSCQPRSFFQTNVTDFRRHDFAPPSNKSVLSMVYQTATSFSCRHCLPYGKIAARPDPGTARPGGKMQSALLGKEKARANPSSSSGKLQPSDARAMMPVEREKETATANSMPSTFRCLDTALPLFLFCCSGWLSHSLSLETRLSPTCRTRVRGRPQHQARDSGRPA
jgi:hypothetical protein